MGFSVQDFTVAHLRRRPGAVESGCFVLGFDPATTSPHVNYATPLPGAEPTGQDVAALVDAFRARDLKPRLEFVPDAAPAVQPALRAAGFGIEATHAYLVCTPDALIVPADRDAPGAHRVEGPTSDEDFMALDAALAAAFGDADGPTPNGTASLRRAADSGGVVRFVRAPDGTCAGGASCSAPAAGTAELAGVGTRPGHRTRGIATAVTAAVTEAMFAKGAESVWLECSGDDSQRVYERLGYRAQGTRLYMALE